MQIVFNYSFQRMICLEDQSFNKSSRQNQPNKKYSKVAELYKRFLMYRSMNEFMNSAICSLKFSSDGLYNKPTLLYKHGRSNRPKPAVFASQKVDL